MAASLVSLFVAYGLYAFFSRGSGTVTIGTNPPGATVVIDGKTLTTPTTFDSIPAGKQTAKISLAGYDPLSISTTVVKNEATDLGTTPLKRSTGLISVTVIPPHGECSLTLVQPEAEGEGKRPVLHFPAEQPWQSPSLPTGTYQIDSTSPGFPEEHDQVQVAAGDTQQVVVDLVKETAAKMLQPAELAAVNAGSIPSGLRSDATSKARLIAYYQDTFTHYLNQGEFDLAKSQLTRLGSDLGVTTTDLESQLDMAKQIAVRGQGGLSVHTDPEGASATINGQTVPTPAMFERLLGGPATLDIKMGGYQPVQQPVAIIREQTTKLDPIALTRFTGALQVDVIPRHADCTLRLVRSDSPKEAPGDIASFSGMHPYRNMALGTGSYSLTAQGEGFAAATVALEVKSGDKLAVTIDLVKEGAKHLLTPDQIPVVDGDAPIPDAMKANATVKAGLVAYYQQIFDGYLAQKEFKQAETVLKRLTGELGVQSAQNQQQLDQLQTEWLTTEKTNLNQLIQTEHFADADALLADMESHSPQPDLRAQLTRAKADHEVAVAQAMAGIDSLVTAGNLAGADRAALDAEKNDPPEQRYALRVAAIEVAMPAEHSRVSARVKTMASEAAANPALAQNADFIRIQGLFQKNLDEQMKFQSEISVLESGMSSGNAQIAHLNARIRENKQKESNYNVGTAAAGVGGVISAFQRSIPALP